MKASITNYLTKDIQDFFLVGGGGGINKFGSVIKGGWGLNGVRSAPIFFKYTPPKVEFLGSSNSTYPPPNTLNTGRFLLVRLQT